MKLVVIIDFRWSIQRHLAARKFIGWEFWNEPNIFIRCGGEILKMRRPWTIMAAVMQKRLRVRGLDLRNGSNVEYILPHQNLVV